MGWLGWVNLALLLAILFYLNDLNNKLFQLQCDFASFQGTGGEQLESILRSVARIEGKLDAIPNGE
jgi:hypothetical protein